jgi:hypothetical protein
MARRAIVDKGIIFSPATYTITIPRVIQKERLLLITNISQNKIIYNFSDPSIGLSSYSVSADPNQPWTTLVLEYNTAAMQSSDTLQVMVDEPYETFIPEPTMIDAVGKLRISSPQSLIDTDFEYGVQGSKWESLSLQNNYPTFFARNTGGNSLDVTSIVGGGQSPRSTVTVTTAISHGLNTGDVVSLNETLSALTDGTFLITVLDSLRFTYTAKGIVSGSVQDGVLTTLYGGGIFDNAHIPGGVTGGLNTWSATSDGATTSRINVVTTNPHGLFPGTPILVSAPSGSAINGSFLIDVVSAVNSFSFLASGSVPVGAVSTLGVGIYCKPEGYVEHRPFDGGVILTTGNNVCGTQTIRQTRGYFRYQSGKSIQFSTGTKFTPSFDISYIASSSTLLGSNTLTITLLQDHNLQAGATVKIEGVETNGAYNPFNGLATVDSVVDSQTIRIQKTFTQAISAIDQLPGGVNAYVTAYQWKGSATRAGLFDDQNGFYFEYDGQTLYAVRRFSNKELYGKITATQYSNVVTGFQTRFRKQLLVGDMIVIRGQSYRVIQINSDDNLNIAPAYRGPSIVNSAYLKTQITKIPQAKWNIDKMDGTGPSGYTLDIAKMQMTYIDYSWYGAGTIRFGMRTVDGAVAWAHRMVQNNINTAAYMRSGNLPARYETINEPLNSAKLISGGSGVSGSTLYPQDTVIYVNDVSFWPSDGYLKISDGANFEICRYTSIGAYNPSIQATAVNLVRRVAQPLVYGGVSTNLYGTATQVNFVPDSTIPGGAGTAQVSVQTISQNCAPVMSHWGSSVIMDGGFNDDKSFIFTAGMQKYIQVGGSGTISATLIQRQASSGVATMTTAGTHSLAAGTAVTITGVNDIATVTYKQLTNNIAYLNTATAHFYTVGQSVTVTGVDTTFNGTYTVALVPSATQIAFNKTAGNIGFQAVSGAAQITASSRYNGTFTISAVGGTTFTFPLSGSDEGISSINPNGTAVQTFGTTPTPRPLISIRVAPSVDNGLARNFGMRELANRMQMKLDSVGVLSQGQFLIEGILNPATMNGIIIPTEWETVRVGSGSLAQVIYHDGTGVRGTGSPVTSPTNTITGGDRIFAFYTENAGGTNYSVTHFDAKKVRDLANCILNGNGSQANPSFPNGPDILTVTATNLGSGAANILCRISWTEAQA